MVFIGCLGRSECRQLALFSKTLLFNFSHCLAFTFLNISIPFLFFKNPFWFSACCFNCLVLFAGIEYPLWGLLLQLFKKVFLYAPCCIFVLSLLVVSLKYLVCPGYLFMYAGEMQSWWAGLAWAGMWIPGSYSSITGWWAGLLTEGALPDVCIWSLFSGQLHFSKDESFNIFL